MNPTGCPWVLLEAKRDTALVGIDLEDLHIDLLAGRHDLAGVDVLLGPAHFGDMDQALGRRARVRRTRRSPAMFRDGALEAALDRILGFDARPRVGLQLLHAERNTLRIRIDADDLHLHGIADVDDFGRMV